MSIDGEFEEYFSALDRAGHEDRCFLCRRTPADVKTFFGFHEDGTPINADQYGIEDIVLDRLDIMSYRGTRPICAVCQLNFDTIFLADNGSVTLGRVLDEIKNKRDELWPPEPEDAT